MIGLAAVLESFSPTYFSRKLSGSVDKLVDLFPVVERYERTAVQDFHIRCSLHTAALRIFF